MTLTKKITTVVAALAVAGALVFSAAVPAAHAALTEGQIQSILSLLQSFGADASTVTNVETSLRGGTPSGGGSSSGGSSSSSVCPYTWSTNLNIGSTGTDVQMLQRFLNDNGFTIASSGAGSPGNETTYYGSLTAAALGQYQAANEGSILTPIGLSAAGVPFPFGPATRSHVNANCTSSGSSSGGGSSTPGPVGTGLSVAAASQPQNALAPQGATRVPFTRITLTAGTDGDVQVNGITVQRVGLGSNASFGGVILVDQDGNQLGTAKTFNSNDQATIGGTFTIPSGQSRTFLVAGNMAASLAAQAGEAPAISVVAVNTSAAVSGSLPITGAFHTINATLTVGTITLQQSNAFATNANATKEIGTTAYRTTGIRLTAGSAEDIRLKTLTFNQTGSASTINDLANIQVVVDGTAYPATVSADGKYVTANLGGGILIAEGNSVEAYLQYDIIGSNANGRTVIFDVDETTDIFAEGVTYGYGVSPSAGASSVPSSRGTFTITSGTPYIYSTQVTISGASVTTIGKSNDVPAQNISLNLNNQPLGGFEVDIKGEAITVQSIVFTVASSSGSGTGLLTNVTIVDENGTVVAGPVDASGAGTSLTFSDSITFPVGKHVYTLRGKVASTIGNGTVYTLSTNPSSQWTNVKGDTTGDTITLSQASFTMNNMTVKAASLAISRSTSPASQTIVPGGTDVLFTNFQLDATDSGEDVRLSSFPFSLTFGGTSVDTDLSSCRFFDGSTVLNTGSNVVNPGDATATTTPYTGTATFDNPITVNKGSVKTLGMKCNVSGSATSGGTYTWDHGTISTFSATGATSGNAITETGPSDTAVTVTVGAGSTTVATDASSPGYKLVAGGSTEVTVGAYKFTATNEALNLQKLGLQLTNTASSSPGDLVKVSVYDGATKVGEAFFTGSNTTATSTFTQSVTVPNNGDKTLTIKADFSTIGTGQSATSSGHFVAIDYLNAEGVGAESGTTQKLGSSAGSTAVAGSRVFKSFPTVAIDTVTSTLSAGRLGRFMVTADSAGPVSISNFAINVATSGANVTNITIYGFTDSGYSSPISGVSGDGNLQATNDCASGCASDAPNLGIEVTTSTGVPTVIQVPAGATRYFEVQGTVSGASTGDSATTKLLGNSSFPSTASIHSSSRQENLLVATSSLTTTTDFQWAPNSTTTVDANSQDWTNGFGISGLPSGGLVMNVSQ